MKKIKQTCYFNPSVAFYFEEVATKRGSTFNQAVNDFIERKIKEEDEQSKVLAQISDIANTQIAILEIIETINNK